MGANHGPQERQNEDMNRVPRPTRRKDAGLHGFPYLRTRIRPGHTFPGQRPNTARMGDPDLLPENANGRRSAKSAKKQNARRRNAKANPGSGDLDNMIRLRGRVREHRGHSPIRRNAREIDGRTLCSASRPERGDDEPVHRGGWILRPPERLRLHQRDRHSAALLRTSRVARRRSSRATRSPSNWNRGRRASTPCA